MRKALIVFNVMLTCLLVWAFSENLTYKAKNSAAKPKHSAVRSSARAVKGSVKKTQETVVGDTVNAAPLPEVSAAAAKVIAVDVFNNVRSPLANVHSGKTELTLLGTFKIGLVEGAIIRQKVSARQYNPYLAQAMMLGGGPGGPGGMSGGMSGNSGTSNSRRASTRSGNARGNSGDRNFGGGRRFSNWSQLGSGSGNSGNSATASVKQYVRVGETLSNGYTLTEVSRTQAVLVRGNDKLELELQDPSKNRASSRTSTGKLNSTQQFQQAQMFMQGQMMRTMMQVQRNMSSGSGSGNARGGRR